MSKKLVAALAAAGLVLSLFTPDSALAQVQVETPVGVVDVATPSTLQLPSFMSDAYTWPRWGETYIDQAVEWQVVQGMLSDSTVGSTVYEGEPAFEPFADVTQAQFVVMLARAVGNAVPDPTQWGQAPLGFTDQTQWYFPALQALTSDGILAPWEFSGGFSPATDLTRGQAAILTGLSLVYYGAHCTGGVPAFSDLPFTYPGYPAIREAIACGVLQGYGGGVFAPGDSLTRAQAATLLVRFVDALPGAEQLGYQTPELTAYIQMVGTAAANWLGPADPLLQANNWDLPAGGAPSTATALAAAPYASWSSIHLYLATGNWIALAEGKYTPLEAEYIADCGLQPWQAGMVDAVLVAYAGAYPQNADAFPLLAALSGGSSTYTTEAAAAGGDLTPVTRVAVSFPSQPFSGDGGYLLGSWAVTYGSGKTVQVVPNLYRESYQEIDGAWWAWRAQSVTVH